MEVYFSTESRTVSSRNIKVLFIDDCEQLRAVVAEVLRSHGFDVVTASGAEEAFFQLQKETPDAVVCDIMMPDTDGFALHKSLKDHSDWCHIPFIFLSALCEPKDIQLGREHGCDEYLTKPFDPEELGAVIRGKVALAAVRKQQSENQFENYRRKIIHTLSHEFRTPLVAINTGTELLLERDQPQEEDQARKLLESIHRGGLRLQRLVEDFMCLQQIETGSAAKVADRLRRRVSVTRLAKESIDHYADLTQDRSLLIEFRDESKSSEKIFVEVYDAQIHNIIARLLSNAHKFAGSTVPAALIVRTTSESASLVVRDRGPGLPEGLVNNACELFGQLNREKLEQQGCGLGLSIANSYANYNRGRLLFHSPLEGRGLEVELKLPRVS